MGIIDQWNAAARQYMDDQEQSPLVASNRQVVCQRFLDLRGQRVLDLGCGYGFYTQYFAKIGADAVGVDGSEQMIRLAREKYPHCHFCQADLEGPLPFKDNSFDLVFCNQVLMDLEQVEHVVAESHRVLRTGGTFYFSIVHPAFYEGDWIQDKNGFCGCKAVQNYITPHTLKNTFWGNTTHFHRPLSYYLNVAAKCGFCLVHAKEPVSYDGVKKTREIPLFFMAEYQK